MFSVITYQCHQMEPLYHVVLIVQEWVMKETLVISRVTDLEVITLLVVLREHVSLMVVGVDHQLPAPSWNVQILHH